MKRPNVRQSPPLGEEEEAHATAGQDFVARIRPLGCALFIILAVLVTIICVTSGRAPIPGYSAPESTEYYSENPEALLEELETSVFPSLEDYEMAGQISEDGKTVTVTIDNDHFVAGRAAVLRYFDESLFVFQRG